MDQRASHFDAAAAAGGAAAPQEAAEGGGAGGGNDPAEEAMDVRYRMMLLEHWKSRVSMGNLREHDHSASPQVRANFRKRRKLAGQTHPQFDEPPPLFAKFTSLGHGMGDSSEEEAGTQASSSGGAAPGAKKSRSGKPKPNTFHGDDVPFGSGPLSIDRRMGWAAVTTSPSLLCAASCRFISRGCSEDFRHKGSRRARGPPLFYPIKG